MAQLKYKRVLLKISGEALAGDKHFGFDFDVVSKVCDVIKKCTDMGVQMGVVIGGGNAAIAVARAARRLTKGSVNMYCLEKDEEMPTVPDEKNAGLADGVVINNSWAPKAILGEGGKVFQLALVDARLRHAVQLDGDAAVQRGAEALHHMGELVPGRDALEHLRAEGVEADVHAVQPGVQKGGQLPGQQDAVGGQGDFVDAGDGFQPRHQLVHVFAHQRLAASDPDGIDAALGKESREAEELFVGQHGLPFQLLHAVRHTVAAAQVAQVGDGEAEIVDIAAGSRLLYTSPSPRD